MPLSWKLWPVWSFEIYNSLRLYWPWPLDVGESWDVKSHKSLLNIFSMYIWVGGYSFLSHTLICVSWFFWLIHPLSQYFYVCKKWNTVCLFFSFPMTGFVFSLATSAFWFARPCGKWVYVLECLGLWPVSVLGGSDWSHQLVEGPKVTR